MPNLNGLQLYYRLKTKNPNIKILFISALDAAEEMVSILSDIGLDYLPNFQLPNKTPPSIARTFLILLAIDLYHV